MLLYDIDKNKGGITSVMLSRSSELTRRYQCNVDLISLDYKENYKEIVHSLRRSGRLAQSVEIYNIHDYYKERNTGRKFSSNQLKKFEKLSSINEEGLAVQFNEKKKYARYFENGIYKKYKKWSENGRLKHVDYFNDSRNRTKRDIFHKEGYVACSVQYSINTNTPIQESFYTADGFCYLTQWYNEQSEKPNKIFLFTKGTDKVQFFRNNKEFHAHWLTQFCREQEEKPYLICDGVGSASKVMSMEPEAAYRIYTIHTNHFDEPYTYGSNIKSDHVKLLNHIGELDALVVLTDSQKNDIVKQFKHKENVHVISNFITPFRRSHLQETPKLVSMISRYHPEKQIDEAILAFREVVKKVPEAKLEIYGHGEDEDRLNTLINELKLQSSVSLMGYVTNVADVLARSNLTVLTSKFEGLNVVSLESMYCKVPVVSYDIQYGMSDIIRDGVTGFIVQAGDKKKLADRIIYLLNNPKVRKEMGEKAHYHVIKDYSKGKICSQWIDLFSKLESQKDKEPLFHE